MTNEILASLIALAYTVAAIAVTLHVLLTHREIRSSFGWIGLAWLSPLLGAMIYVAFGINRVARRGSRINWTPGPTKTGQPMNAAVALAFCDQEETLTPKTLRENIVTIARAGDQISGFPLTTQNAITFLENGDSAYPEMLAAIKGAQRSVALASYIFVDDAAGAQFVDALIDAHQRGVVVRVMIDGLGGGYIWCDAHERLKRAGVRSVLFLHEWLPWKMTFMNLRNHKKLLVIDGKIGFTGGLNIKGENVGGEGAPAVQDVHARLEGSIVAHLLLTFARDWDFSTSEPLLGAKWWPPLEHGGTAAMRGISSGPDEHIGSIEEMWATAVEQAQHTIRILTPYFLPEDRMLDLLRRAALRGVTVQIVVPERTNHFYVNWAFDAQISGLPLDKVECYLTPEPFDHSKLMSIDGVWCALGSPNWDARSMRLNFEFLVECYCADATRSVDDIIDRKIAGAKRLSSDKLAARTVFEKLRNSSARLFLPYL